MVVRHSTDISRPARVVYLRAMASARGCYVDACPCWDLRTRQHPQPAVSVGITQPPDRLHDGVP